MSDVLTFHLAGEPVGKGRPRFAKATGHAFTPARTRSYEGALRLAAQAAMTGRPLFEGPLAVSVLAVFPVPRSWSKKRQTAALAGEVRPAVKPDIDNLLKVLDACNEVVWRDDVQITDAAIAKRYGAVPQLVIRVAPTAGASA